MVYSIQNLILHRMMFDSSIDHISEERNSLFNAPPVPSYVMPEDLFFFFPRFSHKFVLSLKGGLFDSELKSLSNDVTFNYGRNF